MCYYNIILSQESFVLQMVQFIGVFFFLFHISVDDLSLFRVLRLCYHNYFSSTIITCVAEFQFYECNSNVSVVCLVFQMFVNIGPDSLLVYGCVMCAIGLAVFVVLSMYGPKTRKQKGETNVNSCMQGMMHNMFFVLVMFMHNT